MREWRKLHRAIQTSDRLGACSFEARWLWTLLVTAQDDEGRYPWTPAKVRQLVAPGTDWTYARASELAEELVSHGIAAWHPEVQAIVLANAQKYNGQPADSKREDLYELEPYPATQPSCPAAPRSADESPRNDDDLPRLEGEGEGEGEGDREVPPQSGVTTAATRARKEKAPVEWHGPEWFQPVLGLQGYKHGDHANLVEMVRTSCAENGVDPAEVVAHFADYYCLNRARNGWSSPTAALRQNVQKDIGAVVRQRDGPAGRAHGARPQSFHERRVEMERGASHGRPVQRI